MAAVVIATAIAAVTAVVIATMMVYGDANGTRILAKKYNLI